VGLTAKLPIKEINTLVARIDDFMKTNMTSSEANTKRKIIEPLLEILAWNTCGADVILEYPIKIGSTAKHVDYALMLENKPMVFVEAKPFDTVLSDDDSSQIISYGRVEDVKWAVLTNGQILKIFDTKSGKTENECLVTEIDLTKLPRNLDALNLMSRESILSGDIEAAVKRLEATKKAIENLGKQKQQVTGEIKKVLLRITGSEVEKRVDNVSRQLAEQAIQLFRKQVETGPENHLEKGIASIDRKALAAKAEGKVILCPSKIGGVEFLKKYNAWGFVSMSEKRIPYFALYVGRPESCVLYFGEIESITQPLKSKEDLIKIQVKDADTFEAGKRVIHLKPGTLLKFRNPIPLRDKKSAPRGLRYTTLKKLIYANHIGEL
jgi:predicted type IV restriction endonuclease